MKAKTFMVIRPNYYGLGLTIEQAAARAKAAGYKLPKGKRKATAIVVAFSCEISEVKTTADVYVRYDVPEGTHVLQWEQNL